MALARQYLDGLHACFEHLADLAEHPMLGRRADRIALGVRRHECRSHTLKFGKKLQNHAAHVALHFTHYNFCRIHKTLRMSPAMAAGVTDTLRDAEWIVGLVEARQRTWTPGPKKGAKYRPRKRSWSSLEVTRRRRPHPTRRGRLG